MKRLYESILADMEDTLDIGQGVADDIIVNGENSNLRHMFTVGNGGNPFSVSTENGKRILTVDLGDRVKYRGRMEVDCDAYRLSDIISVDEVKVVSGVIIDCNYKGLKEQLCGSIMSDAIAVRGCEHVTGVDFTISKLSQYKYIPYLQFAGTKELRNCNIEFTYDLPSAKIIFNTLPEFNNVTGKGIRSIDIDTIDSTNAIWTNPAFKNLFDFPYTLDVSNVVNGQLEFSDKIKINSMNDIRKITTNKKFYGRVFTEWPVKLRTGAKLSDLIDISKFDSLNTLKIGDKKMGIIFANTKHPDYNPATLSSAYRLDMLMDVFPNNNNEWDKLLDKAPITADGYKVIVYRKV